jgi:AcrR family transcriptional regulator
VEAARELFDERMRRDASVDEIARAAGLSKALVYRAFDSKEEILLLVFVDYLAELETRTADLSAEADAPAQLHAICSLYAEFCMEYPAFLDCALAVMQRRPAELREEVSDGVWLRLGPAVAGCLGPVQRVLAAGVERGQFSVDDPALVANRLCAQLLGSMHLARTGAIVREVAPGVATLCTLAPDAIRDACVRDALRLAQTHEPVVLAEQQAVANT